MRQTSCPRTGQPIGAVPKLIGTTLAGRYELVRQLGDGGMGSVYKAADTVLRRFVAIKLLHPTVAQRPAAVERFQREARAAAAIGHPNIIDILDFGVDGRPYMVMEYLRGRALSQVLAVEGSLPIARAVSIAAHALAGLAAAHERGILHRDLKPANLMLVQRFGDKSFVKVCDFGFAALMGPASAEEAKTLTPARTLVGTPAYAAPERLRGDDRRDPRVDLYSVGVVLFEMLAGRRPFEGETFRDLARAVKHDPPPRLTSLRPDVPPALDAIVQRALAKRPEERFANAGEFAAALVPFGGRTIATEDEPSDSFTFEVWQIRQRDPRKKGTRPSVELPEAPRREAHDDAAADARARPARPSAPKPPRAPTRAEPPDSSSGDHTVLMPTLRALERGREAPRNVPLEEDGLDDVTAVEERAGNAPPRGRAPIAPTPAPLAPADPLAPHPRFGDSGGAEDVVSTQVTLLVRGNLLLAALRFVGRRFGERARRDVIDGLDPALRRPFEEGIEPERWYFGEHFVALVERIDATLGADDLHLVVEVGRAIAEDRFESIQRRIPKASPIELVLSDLPRLARDAAQGIEMTIRRVGRGYARLELLERVSPSLTLTVTVLGLVERILDRFGASDVEVNLSSARALDDPETLIDISWIA